MIDNEKQFENFARCIRFDDTPDPNHRDKLEQDLLAALAKQSRQKEHLFEIWRIIMKSQISKFATAAVIIIAIALGLTTILDKSVTPAYAIEQTIKAMQDVRTVHMFCTGFDDVEFEIWLRINPASDLPEYCYLYCPEWELTLVDTPEGSYQYMKGSNSISISAGHMIRLDLRFNQIFEDIIKELANNERPGKLEVHTEKDADTGQNVIVLVATSEMVEWKFLIDPETKLPVRMHCLRSEQPGMAIKDFYEIYYDEEPPEGIFDLKIPEGAKIVDQDLEMKLLNDPNNGMLTDGLSEKEACILIVKELWQALINQDWSYVRRLWPRPDNLWEEPKARLVENPPIELIEVGEPHIEHACGLGLVTPAIVKFANGKTFEVSLITRFRETTEQSRCVIAGQYRNAREIE